MKARSRRLPLNPDWRQPGDPLYLQTGESHVAEMVCVLDDEDSSTFARARWSPGKGWGWWG